MPDGYELLDKKLRDRGAPAAASGEEQLDAILTSRIEEEAARPNNAEAFIAEFAKDKPVLQELLTGFSQPISAVANLANAGVLGVQGKGQEALGSLGAAARNVGETGRFLSFNTLPPVARPEDIGGFLKPLKTAGVPTLGSLDLPIIGKVTGRGALGFGLDVAADPLRVSRIGELTKAGRAAEAAGGLAKPGAMPGLRATMKGFVRDPSRAGSTLAAEARAGQRALFSFLDRPVIRDIPLPDRLGGSVLEAVDTARRGFARSTLGRAFVRSTLPGTSRTLDRTTGEATMAAVERTKAAEAMWQDFQRQAAQAGIPENEVARQFLLGAERRLPLPGSAAERHALEAKVVGAGTNKARKAAARKLGELDAARRQARTLVNDYRAAGFSRNEAIDAARLVQNFPLIDKDMAPLVAGYMRHFKGVFSTEQNAGVALEGLADKSLNYVTRVLSEEAQEFAKRRPDVWRAIYGHTDRWMSAKHGSTKARDAAYAGMPIPEINDYIATHLRSRGFQGKLFSENPLEIMQRRALREGQGVGAAGFLRATADDWGVPQSPANAATHVPLRAVMESSGMRPYALRGGGNPWLLIDERVKQIANLQGQTQRPGVLPPGSTSLVPVEKQAIQQLLAEGRIVPTKLAGIEDLAVPREIAEDVARVMEARFSPKTPTGIMSLIDDVTRTFKTYVTAPFPEFHVRNAGTGVVHNWYADVRNPVSYADAGKIAKAWRSGAKDSVQIGSESWTAQELLDLMEGHNARLGATRGPEMRTLPVSQRVGTLLHGKPGESVAGRVAKTPLRAAALPFQAVARGGEHVGSFVEDTIRLAHVIEKMRKGARPADAIYSMKKFQFDYCVDADTEMLTRRGWLRYDEVCLSDEALSVDPSTRKIAWTRITRLNVFPARPREMWRWKSTRVDALSTDAHRWLAEGCGVRGGHWTLRSGLRSHFVTSAEIAKGSKRRLLLAGGVPASGAECTVYSDEFVRLIAWTVTEGSFLSQGKGVVVAQSAKHNPAYVEEIRAIGDHYRASGATVSEYSRDCGYGDIRTFYFGKGIGDAIRKAAPDKQITPEFLCSLTVDQQRIFYDTLMKGDGHVRKGSHIWAQKRKDRIDGFQMLCAMMGLRSNARPDRESGCSQITVYRTQHVYSHMMEARHEVHDGIVWCPSTETGTWMARRNGTTYWTGNSDLTPFEKTWMRRVVPFWTWMSKNLPLQIETMVTKPGKISTIAHFQRWLNEDGTGDGPMDSNIVPEWTRRRLFGAKEEGDDLRILGGIGIGLEDLAIFDRPTNDFLAGLNPLLKAPLQYITDRDFFRGVPLDRAEVAPTWLRHFESIPGGKPFLDAIDYRMDEHTGRARANPRWLNLFSGLPVLSASGRFSNVMEKATRDRPDDPNLALKMMTGLRLQKLPRREQMRQHLIGMMEETRDRLDALRRAGITDQKSIYYIEPGAKIRRDNVPPDPRVREAARMLAMERKLGELLSKMPPTAGVEARRESLRSGGR